MTTLELLKSLGPLVAMTMNDDEMPESIRSQLVIPSGNIAYDVASGIGGLPKNRLVEIFGDESSGKTTLTLQAAAVQNKLGKYVEFIDVEHALDMEYALALGCDPDLFCISQPESAEDAISLIYQFCDAEYCSMIILDSIAALATKQELEGEIGDANIATKARLLSANMKRICARASITETCLLFTNQNRDKPGIAYGNPVYQPGGRAVKFHASVRVAIKRSGQNKSESEVISNETEIHLIKNKLARPYTKERFDIEFGTGANNFEACLRIGVEQGVVTKRGSTYALGQDIIGIGEKKAIANLKEDAKTFEAICAALRKKASKNKNPIKEAVEVPSKTRKIGAVPVVEKALPARGKMRRLSD